MVSVLGLIVICRYIIQICRRTVQIYRQNALNLPTEIKLGGAAPPPNPPMRTSLDERLCGHWISNIKVERSEVSYIYTAVKRINLHENRRLVSTLALTSLQSYQCKTNRTYSTEVLPAPVSGLGCPGRNALSGVRTRRARRCRWRCRGRARAGCSVSSGPCRSACAESVEAEQFHNLPFHLN